MLAVLLFILLMLLSYFIGCFSTGRIVAKTYKNLNIYKVGNGYPDTMNIYQNVSKTLGILVGMIDFLKIYLFMHILNFLLTDPYLASQFPVLHDISSQNHILVIGFCMILGHSLPVTHKFIGGRGLLTFIGYFAYFAFWPMVIVSILGLILVFGFKQIRFAQYMIVLLPPFVNFFFPGGKPFVAKMFIAALLILIINIILSKRLGEI